VRIYDVGGRFVRALSTPTDGSGERVLTWDGRDDAGRRAPPGVYLARYRAGLAQGVTRLVKIE
jgi:flagellar hook assembly protein FlgD